MAIKQIDRFEIQEQIGRGGMAVVYRAYDPQNHEDVAVKVLPPEFMKDSRVVERFKREAQAASTLRHEAILPVYEFGFDENRLYMVMRYLRGGSLAMRLREMGVLSYPEVLNIVERICAALDEAHGRSIVHRDVKPSNILLDELGNPFLADFGLVKMLELASEITGSGVVGTPYYAAPEIMESEEVTPLVDVYAIGVMIYEMLTGYRPFTADTPLAIMMMHIHKPIPDARRIRPELPDDLQALIEHAMAKDPAERYQHAGYISEDLRAALMGA
ncbi:MAG: serine/threonine protein kinase [Chloroflexi bacterium]|nr:serine/threonine protein kinase [Chloroflexota bacterium]